MDVWVLTVVTHFLFMGFVPAQHVERVPYEYASLEACLQAGASASQERVGYAGVAWMPVTRRGILCEKEASV